MPFNIGPGELILILVIALVVLGPGKLPDVANSLGKSVREFRKAATDISDAGKLDVPKSSVDAPPPSAQSAPPPPPLDSPVTSSAPPATTPDAEAAPAGSPARDPNLS
jgi:TatA/E family protein of Tat protein translocase